MTNSPDANPFFPPDWREQVRDYLAPFEDEDEEILNEYWFNVVREQTKQRPIHTQATLRFGDIFLERESRAYDGAEHRRTIIYARKSGFSTILHFWAYAALSFNAMNNYSNSRPLISCWIDFRERKSQLLSPTDFRAAVEQQWPVEKFSLPAVWEETVLQAWQYSSEWYEWFAVAETNDSFVLWCRLINS